MKLLCCALALLIFQSVHATTYTLHTVHSGSVPSRVRIVNLSDAHGVVEIVGFDDQGEEYGPVELDIEAHASVVLLTRELENGAPDKGLMDGLGDGSGQWQLELTTDLEIGAVSFKGGVLSDVMSSAEEAGGSLSEHFKWAHKLADKHVSLAPFLSGHTQGRGEHELLSAYSWEPLDEVDGVTIGEGDYEHPHTVDAWRRLGGRLEYSFFAVQYGMLDGVPSAHAYTTGRPSRCQRPPDNAKYVGAAVFVSEQGQFGYGVVDVEMDANSSLVSGTTTLTQDDFHKALYALGIKFPHGFIAGSYPGGLVHVGETEAIWNDYQWNPPMYMPSDKPYGKFDPDADPKPTWNELVRASLELTDGLKISTQIYDKETGKTVVAQIHDIPGERIRVYGPTQQCLELGGWVIYDGQSYMAFGARRTDTTE